MKIKPLIHLLRMGQFISRRTNVIQRSFLTAEDIFHREMNVIHEVVLLYLGVMRVKDDTLYSVNMDYQKFIRKWTEAYFHEKVSLKETLLHLQRLRVENVYYIGMEMVKEEPSTDIVNRLFELKYLLQFKRQQLGYFFGSEHQIIRYEKLILGIALEELGDKRYFKNKKPISNPYS